MENLWPDDLLDGASKHFDGEIEQTLAAQAEGLGDRTDGLVTGVIRDISVLPGRAWAFCLHPANQPAKRTQLFIVRSQDGKFPVVIENFNPDKERHQKVTGLSGLRTALQAIFLSQQAKRIVKLFAIDAVDAGAKLRKRVLKRPKFDVGAILVGNVVPNRGKDCALATIFRVSGFLSKEILESFLIQPDAQGSAIARLNDKYVVTFHFIDSCKISLNETELGILRAEAKNAILQHPK